MITIVDYGMGNLGSLRNMLKRVGEKVAVATTPQELAGAKKIVLPGVGAFDTAMERIAALGLEPVLRDKALHERVPVLGVCLGMQLLTSGSEEGTLPGLGWIPASAHRFPPGGALKVPHMGWNSVRQTQQSALTGCLPVDARFYFVHSYFVRVEDERDSLLKASYGLEFDAAIRRGNVYGVQFHPEKSHRFGMAIFKAFSEL